MNIKWQYRTSDKEYLGLCEDNDEAEIKAFIRVDAYPPEDPTYDIHCERMTWWDACEYWDFKDTRLQLKAQMAYIKYLEKAFAPDASGMDKWMAEKQAEHFGTDAGVGNPPEGNG